MATITREQIGSLHDKLIVKVVKDDYYPSFDKKLKEYSKTANIPGFRKGMVPPGMIKKMYGSSIFTDEVLKSVEKELYHYLETERPEIFGQPLPLANDIRNLDIDNPSEYEFGFEIGLKPEYVLADLSNARLTLYKVKATDEMIEEEVKRMQIKAGNMTEPEMIDNEENVLNILFKEADANGNTIENGVIKENSLLLKYLLPEVKSRFIGKMKGDKVVLQLNEAFNEEHLAMILQDLGYEKDDAEAAKKFYLLEIVKVGLVEKREMNEEFFDEIYPGKNIKTENELRDEIRKEIQDYYDVQSRNQLQDQLYHYVLDETKMEFPADFLKRWLQTGGEKAKTAEEAEEEFPSFSSQLKWTIISDKLIRENKLEVTNEELLDSMKLEVMRYFGSTNMGEDTGWLDSYVSRMMKDEKQVDVRYRRLITDKLFTLLEGQVKPEEKEVTGKELADMMHHHHH